MLRFCFKGGWPTLRSPTSSREGRIPGSISCRGGKRKRPGGHCIAKNSPVRDEKTPIPDLD